MKTPLSTLLLASATLLVTGCNAPNPAAPSGSAGAPAAPTISKADAIASVNGQFIAKKTFDNVEKELAMRAQGQPPFPKEKLLEELIQRELLIQEAVKNQLDKTPEVAERLEEAKKAILTQAAVQSYIKNNPVTDAEIKAEYDSKFAASNNTEYKARHILVKTEAEAKKLIAELDKGADFAKLANKHSLDGKEAQNGGDLGWFVANQMVEPFSKAVMALEKGKYTTTPVQTQFGWHVILREDSRAQTPPPVEAVKEQMLPFLQRKKIQDMLEGLRKQAKVEILQPVKDEAPQPAAAEPMDEEAKAINGKIEEAVKEEAAKAAEPAEPKATEKTEAKPAEKAKADSKK